MKTHPLSTRLLWVGVTAALLAVEIAIALWGKGALRAYVGNILVIPLLAAAVRILSPSKPKLLGIYLISAGVIAEILQYFQAATLLGVENTPLGIILGATFDVRDIVCYAVGGIAFFACERMIKK